MRIDQSGSRGGDFSPYKSAPLWLWECTLSFHRRLETARPWLELNTEDETLKVSCQNGFLPHHTTKWGFLLVSKWFQAPLGDMDTWGQGSPEFAAWTGDGNTEMSRVRQKEVSATLSEERLKGRGLLMQVKR